MLEQVRSRPVARRRTRLSVRLSHMTHRMRIATGQLAVGFDAWVRRHRRQLITTSMSLVIHLLIALGMALWILPPESSSQILNLFLNEPAEEVEPIELTEFVVPESLDQTDLNSSEQLVPNVVENVIPELMALEIDHPVESNIDPIEMDVALMVDVGVLGGRSAMGKQAALRKYGGTKESENAVDAGLKWLQRVQLSDGSWNFATVGSGAVSGSFREEQMGATALALLCFLGAGHSYDSPGPYEENVKAGLKYIVEHATVRNGMADLRGNSDHPGMYVHGITTIALCEAHAMGQHDSRLRKLAQQAVKFIEAAQDPRGGGWRYQKKQPGDTSVVGWQVMALQSALMGDLRVSKRVLKGAEYFLVSVQREDGAGYRYVPGNGAATPTMTAVGLLCRMYLGWRHDNIALARGVAALSARGPSPGDMYYNYYATQVLHHWGGTEWTRWNETLREHLIKSQIRKGPAAGSWKPGGGSTSGGGQLLQTALCLLTLEVYYRHLPMYGELSDPGP